MKTYTKEQLIEAQHKYNCNVANNPEDFMPEDDFNNALKDKQTAIDQINYLLTQID